MKETLESIIAWHRETFPDETQLGQWEKFREEKIGCELGRITAVTTNTRKTNGVHKVWPAPTWRRLGSTELKRYATPGELLLL